MAHISWMRSAGAVVRISHLKLFTSPKTGLASKIQRLSTTKIISPGLNKRITLLFDGYNGCLNNLLKPQTIQRRNSHVTNSENPSKVSQSEESPVLSRIDGIIEEIKGEFQNKGPVFNETDWKYFGNKITDFMKYKNENMWYLSLVSSLANHKDVYSIGQEVTKFAKDCQISISPIALSALIAMCAKDTTISAETKEKEIFALLEETRKLTKVLDVRSLLHIIDGLSATSKWQEGFEKVVAGEYFVLPNESETLEWIHTRMLPILLHNNDCEKLLDQVCEFFSSRILHTGFNSAAIRGLNWTTLDDTVLHKLLSAMARHGILVKEPLATKIETLLNRYKHIRLCK